MKAAFLGALALLLLVAAGPAPSGQAKTPPATPPAAAGPERPPLAPTREASVLYRIASSPTESYEIRITSLAGNSRRRIDLPDKSYMLVNPAAEQLQMVSPFEGTVMDVPWDSGLGLQFTLDPTMKFSRKGTSTIAGLRCTTYGVSTAITSGEACVTDDGVMLRTLAQNNRGQRTAIEALSVSYTPAPDTDYVPPAGFERVLPRP